MISNDDLLDSYDENSFFVDETAESSDTNSTSGEPSHVSAQWTSELCMQCSDPLKPALLTSKTKKEISVSKEVLQDPANSSTLAPPFLVPRTNPSSVRLFRPNPLIPRNLGHLNKGHGNVHSFLGARALKFIVLEFSLSHAEWSPCSKSEELYGDAFAWLRASSSLNYFPSAHMSSKTQQ